jgi:hypothetical protein
MGKVARGQLLGIIHNYCAAFLWTEWLSPEFIGLFDGYKIVDNFVNSSQKKRKFFLFTLKKI